MNYALTIAGQPVTITTNDAAQIAGLGQARANYNASLAEDDEKRKATDAAYFEWVLNVWAEANPDGDVQAVAASALASYAGQQPPEPQAPELSPEAQIAALKAYAADKRFRVETGGVVSEGFGPLLTDRPTQAFLGRIIQSIDLGIVTPPIRFKGPGGFVPLEREHFIAIAAVVGAHVQAAFDAEADVIEAIEGGTITTYAEVEAADWP